jgi:hypothetical protein
VGGLLHVTGDRGQVYTQPQQRSAGNVLTTRYIITINLSIKLPEGKSCILPATCARLALDQVLDQKINLVTGV